MIQIGDQGSGAGGCKASLAAYDPLPTDTDSEERLSRWMSF